MAAFLLNKQLGKLHLPLRLYFGQNLNIGNTSAVSSTASSMKMIKMLREVPSKKVRLKAKVQVRPTGRCLPRSSSNRLKSVSCIFHIGINQRRTNRHYFLQGRVMK